MPRKVPPRPSYAGDASYLVRLAQAIEQDTRQDPEWRSAAVALLQELVARLSKARR